jgi:CHAT domain-containing protein
LVRTATSASKDAAVSLAAGQRRYRFWHFACHGLLDIEKPQFSGLLLSPDPSGDPFWQALEIFDARIPAEMVVLSACESGLGPVLDGEGVFGLSRAFLHAGARSVCVSLWRVADASTGALMEGFYSRLVKGMAAAEAFQSAKLEMLDGTWAHPFYWAPFVLIGGDPVVLPANSTG